MRKLHHFRSEEAGEIIESAFADLRPILTGSISRALEESLDQYLVTSPLISLDALKRAGTPQVLLRIRTLQILLDAFRQRAEPGYEALLRRAGRSVGLTFGIEMIALLEEKGRIPIDLDSLLRFWSLYDSSAGMGILEPSMRGSRLTIRIRDNFLTVDYASGQHPHCPFWEGYLQAALDSSMCMWLRWIENAGIHKVPKDRWMVVDARENPLDSPCSFELKLAPEVQAEPRDQFTTALIDLREGRYTEAVQKGRIALELSVKGMIGLPGDFKVSFGKFKAVCRDLGVPLSYEKWEDAYAVASDPMHLPIQVNLREAVGTLQSIQTLLVEAISMELSPQQREDLLGREAEYRLPGKRHAP